MEKYPNNNRNDFYDDEENYDVPAWEKRSRRRNDRRTTKQDLRNLNWDEVDIDDYIDDEWEKFDGSKH